MNWNNDLPIAATDERRTVFRLTSGAVIGVDHPQHAQEVGEPVAIVGAVLRSIGALDAATRSLAADETLSDIGRERKLEPLREALRHAVAKARTDLERLDGEVAKMQEAVFAPPAIDKTDVVTALGDMELRNLIRGLGGDQRNTLLQEISAMPRILAAVLRSPVPIPSFTEVARNAWIEHAAKTHPEAARTVRHQETTAWAGEALRHASAAVADIIAPPKSLAQQAQEARRAKA